jgi:hypothetical protein
MERDLLRAASEAAGIEVGGEVYDKACGIVRRMNQNLPNGSLGNAEIARHALGVEFACRTSKVPFNRIELMKRASVSGKDYQNAFRIVKSVLKLDWDQLPTIDVLATRFGLSFKGSSYAVLEEFQKKYPSRLEPGAQQSVNVHTAMYHAAAFAYSAKKRKVKIDQKAIVEHADITAREFNASMRILAYVLDGKNRSTQIQNSTNACSANISEKGCANAVSVRVGNTSKASGPPGTNSCNSAVVLRPLFKQHIVRRNLSILAPLNSEGSQPQAHHAEILQPKRAPSVQNNRLDHEQSVEACRHAKQVEKERQIFGQLHKQSNGTTTHNSNRDIHVHVPAGGGGQVVPVSSKVSTQHNLHCNEPVTKENVPIKVTEKVSLHKPVNDAVNKKRELREKYSAAREAILRAKKLKLESKTS